MENNKGTFLFIVILLILVCILTIKFEDYNLIKSKYNLLETTSNKKLQKHLEEIDSLTTINDSLNKELLFYLESSDSIRATIDSIINTKDTKNVKDIVKIKSVYNWNDSLRNKFWADEFSKQDSLLPTKKISIPRR